MIHPQEQLRVLVDVARRYPRIHVLEIPCERGNGHIVFPVNSMGGGPCALMAVFYTGSLPEEPTEDFGAQTNQYRLTQWKTGTAASVCWAFGLNGDALYKLLDSAAQALMTATRPDA